MPRTQGPTSPADAPADSAATLAAPAPAGWVRRYAPRVVAGGVAVSLIVHAVLLLLAALIIVRTGQAGGAGEPAGSSFELAVVTEAELAQLEAAALDAESPEAAEEIETPLPEINLDDADGFSDDLADLSAPASDADISTGGGDISGGDLGSGGGTGGGASSFFGAEARGSRFAYVVDVSGSMSVGGKIEALRRELARSVHALTDQSSFYVALYHSDAAPLGGENRWVKADDDGKVWAGRWIEQIGPEGGTVPMSGFTLVSRLRPRPDAIYFLTDGEFEEFVAIELRRLFADARVPIHCICFVSNAAEPLMRQIAKDSGGSYTFVPGTGR